MDDRTTFIEQLGRRCGKQIREHVGHFESETNPQLPCCLPSLRLL